MNKAVSTIVAFGATILSLISQGVLSPQEVIVQTLANNYNIKLANNDLLIAENNTDKALLGFNPTVSVQAGINSNINNNTTNFSSGESIVTGYGFAYSANTNVSANYNLIDPSRELNLNQLQEQVALSDLQKQLTIQNKVAQVLTAYYNASRAAGNIEILRDILSLSQERLERLNIQNQYGQASRLDLLNAQVDIDRDSINIANAELNYQNSIRTLNNLIGIHVSSTYKVEAEINYDITRSLTDMIKSCHEKNIQVRLIDQSQAITEMNYDIIDASQKPILGANANYNFNYNRSAPGSFFSSSRSDGLGLGLTLNYNIYDGGIRKNQRQNTKLTIEGQGIQKEQLINDLTTQLSNTWHQFQNALFIIKAEESNVQTAVVNFDRTNEEYKTGRVSSIEYRQAQINLLNSENSLLNARYDAKLLEIQMLLLIGEILEM